MTSKERKRAFVREIWRWYVVHKRHLPWRDLQMKDETERAYRILVSEIMLQQTQVPRVKVIYKRFLKQFPTLKSLARANNGAVIRAWSGMGYNRRALYLRDAAKVIVEKFHGAFPKDMDNLRSLPGIGHYTAAAIRNFAFNLPTPCLDTNIRRILHRTFVGPENPDGTWKKGDKYLLRLAGELLELTLSSTPVHQYTNIRRGAAEWHAALMDFGSLVCTKKNPRWDLCPLTKKEISKTTPSNFLRAAAGRLSRSYREPSRKEHGKHVPNRIFRGRVIEQLRNRKNGMTVIELGKTVKKDWRTTDRKWLRHILRKLEADGLLQKKKSKYSLPL